MNRKKGKMQTKNMTVSDKAKFRVKNTVERLCIKL